MRHVDLFSGIGGFSLAASWVWGAEHEIVTFCEINEFCQKVLKKHWPDVPCVSDIHEITGEVIWEKYVQNVKRLKSQRIDRIANHVIPKECLNGERKTEQSIEKHHELGVNEQNLKLLNIMEGNVLVVENQQLNFSPLIINSTMAMPNVENINPKHGNLHSKEDFQKTIKSFATTVTMQGHIMENVHMKKEEMLIDLLTAGVPCQPASCAGKRAGEKDDRWLWPEVIRIIREICPRWVLYENVYGMVTLNNGLALDQVLADLESEGYETQAVIIPACSLNAPHRRNRVWIVAYCSGKQQQGVSKRLEKRESINNDIETEFTSFERDCCNPGTDTDKQYDDNGRLRTSQISQQQAPGIPTGEQWEVEPGICRVVDGIPNRVDRLRALGNAIVPQVAAQIMYTMKQVDCLIQED